MFLYKTQVLKQLENVDYKYCNVVANLCFRSIHADGLNLIPVINSGKCVVHVEGRGNSRYVIILKTKSFED